MARWVLAALTLPAFAVLAPRTEPVRSAPEAVPVRWAEGTLHGFLELRSTDGTLLAHGDQLQIPRDSHIETRLIFHFADSSMFSETVTFTQRGAFELESYHLIQNGKAFDADLDARFSRNGEYEVRTRSHEDGEEKRYSGTLDLPPDVYNGMVPVIAKNIPARARRNVHIVAFTPKPYVITLEIAPSATEPVRFGRRDADAVRFTLKPKLNLLLRIGAALKGATPPDSYLWIVTEDVPAFVRFEGPMYSGPVWRIDLQNPDWPAEK